MVKLERPVLYGSSGGLSSSKIVMTQYYEHVASGYVVLMMPLGSVGVAWVDYVSSDSRFALDCCVLVPPELGSNYLWERYAFRAGLRENCFSFFRPFRWSYRDWLLSPHSFVAVMSYFVGDFDGWCRITYWCYEWQYELVNRGVDLLDRLGYVW